MNAAERFVEATLQRYDVLLFEGVDIDPGAPWSMRFEDSRFIQGLQKMGDPRVKSNLRWWIHLHCGRVN